MKICSPIRSSHKFVDENINPRVRDFRSPSKWKAVSMHLRPNCPDKLYDADEESFCDPNGAVAGSAEINHRYKVSEIINPDGTVTVRNLIVNPDGSWECLEEERDYHHVLDSTSSSSCSAVHPHSNNMLAPDKIPGLISSASFESTRSSTSSDTMKTSKSRLGLSTMSAEGAAHELRRQRLAKAQTVVKLRGIPGSPSTTFSTDNNRFTCSSPKSVASSASSHMMMLMKSPVSASRTFHQAIAGQHFPESPPHPKRTSSLWVQQQQNAESLYFSKRVAFTEHANPFVTPTDLTSAFSSYDGTEGCNSVEDLGTLAPSANEDDESSVFRNVLTPSPELDRIEAILGPLSPSSSQKPSTSRFVARDFNASDNNTSPSSGIEGRLEKEKSQLSFSSFDKVHRNGEDHEDPKILHIVTVHKSTYGEKIGIHVGLKRFSFGTRLVVSKVAPDGKFANSGVDVGDIIVSINGKSMLERPSSLAALDIVKEAPDRLTFVVQKLVDTDDARSVSGSTISSVSRDLNFQPNPDISWIVESTPNSEGNWNEVDSLYRRKMTSKGCMIVSRDTQVMEPLPMKAKETWEVSGACVVVVKKSELAQQPGLMLGTKELTTGRILYITEIDPSGPFAPTPLRPGDVILSINDVDLAQNADVLEAHSALGRPKEEISLVARKNEESLNIFLKEQRACADESNQGDARETMKETSQRPVESSLENHSVALRVDSEEKNLEIDSKTMKDDEVPVLETANDSSWRSFDFNEESYGASLHGYNPSKSVRITKSHSGESVGLDLMCVSCEWGEVLTIANVAPESKAAATNLRVGDAVIAINGTDFRGNPSVEVAKAILRHSTVVIIEVQHLSFVSTLSGRNMQEAITIHESESNCVGVVRTRTFDSIDDFLSQTETLKIAGEADSSSGSETEKSKKQSLHKNEEVSRMPAVMSQHAVYGNSSNTSFKTHRKLRVTITKHFPQEKVGISFAVLEKTLIVTNVSPTGLLIGTPVLPGDTILSINAVDFSTDPDAQYAFDLVSNAPREICFEILKTGYTIDPYNNSRRKSCLGRSFGCGRKKKQEYAVRLVRQDFNARDTLSTSLVDPIQF